MEIKVPGTWDLTTKKEKIVYEGNERDRVQEVYQELEDNPYLFRVPKNTLEYRNVVDLFHKGSICSRHIITNIYRNQNPHLYAYHEIKRQEMNLKHGYGINTYIKDFGKLLWHGTSGTKPSIITDSEEGIDRRFQKVRETIDQSKDDVTSETAPKFYGLGSYFSTMPGYSDNQYAHQFTQKEGEAKDVYQMILCRVVTGIFDYGLDALEGDQMRTLSKQDLNTVIANKAKLDEKKLQELVKEEYPDEYKKAKKSKKLKELEEKYKKSKAFHENFGNRCFFPERNETIRKKADQKVPVSKAVNADALKFDSIMDDRFAHVPGITKDDKIGTVVDKPRMYVTFENSQAYPEYIVSYKRGDDKKKNE